MFNPTHPPRTRRAGHNRPKNASDWFAQIATGVTALVAAIVGINIGGGLLSLICLVFGGLYILLVGWLGHMEDRAKANRIWAVIWAVSAVMAVRAHEQRHRVNSAPQPPPAPGTWNGIDYGNR